MLSVDSQLSWQYPLYFKLPLDLDPSKTRLVCSLPFFSKASYIFQPRKLYDLLVCVSLNIYLTF